MRERAAVRLRIRPGTFSSQPDCLAFQCDDGSKYIDCAITTAVLRDLIDFHRLRERKKEAFRALLPEIERLANAKYNAGRISESGEMLIRTADLLRYGFGRWDRSAA
jgi:hypothetical protein